MEPMEREREVRQREVDDGAVAVATASLVAELELLRRQKAAAEESSRRLDGQVG